MLSSRINEPIRTRKYLRKVAARKKSARLTTAAIGVFQLFDSSSHSSSVHKGDNDRRAEGEVGALFVQLFDMHMRSPIRLISVCTTKPSRNRDLHIEKIVNGDPLIAEAMRENRGEGFEN